MANNKGYILLVTLIVAGLLMLFGISYVNFFVMEKDLTRNGEDELIAEAAAFAGIAEAVSQLNANKGWKSGFLATTLPVSRATYEMTFNASQPFYSTNNIAGNTAVAGYGGRQVPPKMIHLVSVGRFGRNYHLEEAMLGGSPFQMALLANNAVSLNGALTIDSMTSPVSGGNVGTNSSAAGIVTLNGNVTVQGLITLGAGGTASSIISNGGASYQGYQVSTKAQNIPIFASAAGTNLGNKTYSGGSRTLAPGTYGKLTMSGNAVVTLQSGTYVFTDDIKSTGCTLRLQSGASATIYAGKNIAFSGNNNINVTTSGGGTGSASNFIVYAGENTTSVTFQGNYTARIGLYAPAADVSLAGTADYYGAAIGKTLTVNGVASGRRGLGVHYDANLTTTVIMPVLRARW